MQDFKITLNLTLEFKTKGVYDKAVKYIDESTLTLMVEDEDDLTLEVHKPQIVVSHAISIIDLLSTLFDLKQGDLSLQSHCIYHATLRSKSP